MEAAVTGIRFAARAGSGMQVSAMLLLLASLPFPQACFASMDALYTAPVPSNTGRGPSSAVVGDLRGDSRQDLVASNGGANPASILLDSEAPVAQIAGILPRSLFAVSYDNDVNDVQFQVRPTGSLNPWTNVGLSARIFKGNLPPAAASQLGRNVARKLVNGNVAMTMWFTTYNAALYSRGSYDFRAVAEDTAGNSSPSLAPIATADLAVAGSVATWTAANLSQIQGVSLPADGLGSDTALVHVTTDGSGGFPAVIVAERALNTQPDAYVAYAVVMHRDVTDSTLYRGTVPLPILAGPGGDAVVFASLSNGLVTDLEWAGLLRNSPVLVSSLEASPGRDHIDLHWYALDAATATFQVERATRAVGPYVAVGDEIHGVAGQTFFSFADRNIELGTDYFYRIAYKAGADVQYAGPIKVSMPAARFGLRAVGPSPAAGNVRVSYALDRASSTTVEILDLAGRRVRVLEHGAKDSGAFSATWDGRNASGREAAAGVYFVRLVSGAQVAVRGVVLVR
jgi:hypothetical protein